MASPTPTSPTLNDLQYGSYNQAGYVNVSTLVPGDFISVNDIVQTRESLVLNMPGISYSVDTSDFIGTVENISVTLDPVGPNQYSISVSDTIDTSESQTFFTNPLRLSVSDTVTTSESKTVSPPA